jgi:D-alanyl-D-alanine carboxypeptidase
MTKETAMLTRAFCTTAATVQLLAFGTIAASAGTISLDEKLRILKNAYPSLIADVKGGKIHLTSGEKLTVDDGKPKDHQGKLKRADIEDSLSQIYPLGACHTGKPARNFDPGRIRNEWLMRIMFGNSKGEAQSNLRSIKWFGNRVRVTRRFGTDKALERVRADLAKLPKRFRKYFVKLGGTFNWRNIAKTKRLSVHSFGAAIDINTKYTDYWIWSGGKPGNVPRYKNKIPKEIVSIFEQHGFIWGGKWYHYDTMHFEYRPELIEIGKLALSRGCPSG